MTDEGPADPLALTSFAPTRLIRRRELRRLVPLSDTTMVELPGHRLQALGLWPYPSARRVCKRSGRFVPP